MARTFPLIQFDSLKTVEDLCFHLQCAPSDLVRVVNVRDHVKPLCIRRRKSSRPRVVYDVDDPLRRMHRLLALSLYSRYSPWPKYVQGYAKRRSVYTNALAHVARPSIVCFDLRDFFDSISSSQVASVWEEAGANRRVAVVLAQMCVLDGKLLQGGRASPVIANVVCRGLDRELQDLVGPSCTYTRYADDIAISGAQLPNRADVERAVSSAGFAVGEGTWRVQSVAGGRRFMGLSLTERRPRLSRRIRKLIERHVQVYESGGQADKRLDGWLKCYRLVEPRLCAEWERRLAHTDASPPSSR